MPPFRWNCTHRGRCWLTARWDSNSIGAAARAADEAWRLPRGISPTDVDGLLECNGHVLLIESKPAGVELPRGGQRKALETLARMGATVLIQECEVSAEDSVVFAQCILPSGRWTRRFECDRLARDIAVRRWCEWADAGGTETHPWDKGRVPTTA